jgi:hypothetical protein
MALLCMPPLAALDLCQLRPSNLRLSVSWYRSCSPGQGVCDVGIRATVPLCQHHPPPVLVRASCTMGRWVLLAMCRAAGHQLVQGAVVDTTGMSCVWTVQLAPCLCVLCGPCTAHVPDMSRCHLLVPATFCLCLLCPHVCMHNPLVPPAICCLTFLTCEACGIALHSHTPAVASPHATQPSCPCIAEPDAA